MSEEIWIKVSFNNRQRPSLSDEYEIYGEFLVYALLWHFGAITLHSPKITFLQFGAEGFKHSAWWCPYVCNLFILMTSHGLNNVLNSTVCLKLVQANNKGNIKACDYCMTRCEGIPSWSLDFPHKRHVMQKSCLCDDVAMSEKFAYTYFVKLRRNYTKHLWIIYTKSTLHTSATECLEVISYQ